MGLASGIKDVTLREDDVVFECPLTKASLTAPCNVTTCNYQVSQVVSLGMKPKCPTNCCSVDFFRQFEDTLDFAIKESGRVGFRDLEYLALFLNTPVEDLKNIYEKGTTQIKQIMLFQYYSMHIDLDGTCSMCGRKKTCSLSCNLLRTVVDDLLKDILPVLKGMMPMQSIYACVWYDLRNMKQLFEEHHYPKLQELYRG